MLKTATLEATASRTANIIGGLAVAAVFGAFALAPGKYPNILTHDMIDQRIAALDGKAAPFAARIGQIEADINRPVTLSYRTRDELAKKRAEIKQFRAARLAELESVRKDAQTVVCDDYIIKGGRNIDIIREGKGQIPDVYFDDGVHAFPQNIQTACNTDPTTKTDFPVSPTHLREFSGFVALLGLLNAAYYALPGRKKKDEK
jgi:hypothetical protein